MSRPQRLSAAKKISRFHTTVLARLCVRLEKGRRYRCLSADTAIAFRRSPRLDFPLPHISGPQTSDVKSAGRRNGD
jgi:hypothetical protein